MWKRIVVLFLAAAAVVLFFAVFRLKTVVVSGNVHSAPSEITEILLQRPVLGNTVLTMLLNNGRTVEGPGFADRLKVRITGRNSVRVEVSERQFVGRTESGGNWYYFDSSGEVLASAGDPKTGDGIPPVEGLELLADVEVMKYLPITNSKIFSMLGMLRNRIDVKEEMMPDKVIFGSDSSMTLVYGSVKVLMGSGEKLEMRLRELSGVISELKAGYSGTLHLENYDGSQSGLVFDPTS